MPLITIITPTYNRARFIGETIESVLCQTCSDWELIIVDDGSTDDTHDVVARYSDERIRYVRQANAGETAARNSGIALARGNLLAFIDSDDVMLPHNLETLAATLAAHPEAGCAYGWFYFMDEAGEPIHNTWGTIRGEIPHQLDQPWPGRMPALSGTSDEGQILPQLLGGLEGTIVIGSFLVRRTWLEAAGGFDPARKHQGHWDFFVRLARAGCAYVCCRQAMMILRDHAAGAHRDFEKMVNARLDVLNQIYRDAESDPQLMAQIEPVRVEAYHTTYVIAAKNSYAIGNLAAGAQYLNLALQHGQLNDAVIEDLISRVVKWILENPQEDVDGTIHTAFAMLGNPALTRHANRRARALVDFNLAFRAFQAGQRRETLAYSVKAVAKDPRHLKNRGLAKMVLTSLDPRHR